MPCQPTVREKLLALHKAVGDAELDRAVYLTELRNDGYSLRQLGSVLGVTASTVMRWAPLDDDGPKPSLDDPA
jgi:hypothetical protein